MGFKRRGGEEEQGGQERRSGGGGGDRGEEGEVIKRVRGAERKKIEEKR